MKDYEYIRLEEMGPPRKSTPEFAQQADEGPKSPAKSVHFSEENSQAGGGKKKSLSNSKKRRSLSRRERSALQKRRKQLESDTNSDACYMVKEQSPGSRKSSKSKKTKKVKKSPAPKPQPEPRLTFDQQIDLLPEISSPNFLASSVLRRDYAQTARSIMDQNIQLFDSNCFFHPQICPKSQQLAQRPPGRKVHLELFEKSSQLMAKKNLKRIEHEYYREQAIQE
jgi:hypothetical protein